MSVLLNNLHDFMLRRIDYDLQVALWPTYYFVFDIFKYSW